MKPRIAITRGDPAGIGPEIVRKALRDVRVRRACEPVVVGQTVSVPPGRPSKAAGRVAIAYLEEGLQLLRSKHVQAMVTAPVSKESFHLAHYGFPGHTEYLAHQAGVKDAAMLMVAGPLRALLLTRHVPLARVSQTLTIQTILQAARLADQFLKKHVRRHPRMVLCGVNPHAGDNGLIGLEEKRIFAPALQTLRRQKIRLAGPIAADTVFRDMAKGNWDLALAAYHDQGMIPLKLYAPGRLVNVTLGLPYIRTSPGHGTAYDIAGKNRADPNPMIEAILLAAHYA